MLHKIKGVVFRFTKYGETSIIASIFTDELGLQSYIVNGIRSRTARSRIALFQPLTLLELVVYHRENANINRIKEVKCLYPYHSIHDDVTKSTVAMFLTEVVNKVVREEAQSRELCEFLIHSFITLDMLEDHAENFHLVFLLRLSRFLGFGARQPSEVLGGRITTPLIEGLLTKLISAEYTQALPMKNAERREITDLIVHYYAEHTGMSPELKSTQVLREILQ